MKKELLLTTATFLLIATPAFAKSDNSNNGQGDTHQSNTAQQVLATHDTNGQSNEDHGKPTVTPSVAVEATNDDNPSVTPSVTVTLTPTPSEKKHGLNSTQTCDPNALWKNHGAYVSCVAHTHQGGTVTSEAAQSDIGKKHTTPTPSVNPSASPTATLTPTLTPPITSAANALSFNSFLDIPGLLKKLAHYFTHLRV